MSGFELVYMDDFIDELLHEERCCDVILPRIQVHRCGLIITSPSDGSYLPVNIVDVATAKIEKYASCTE